MLDETVTANAHRPLPRYTRLARVYDALYRGAGKDYQSESQQVHALIEQYRRCSDTTLLDVACGTGAHLDHLRAWYAVEGLDMSTDMLDMARKRLSNVPLHWANMIDFNLKKQFGAITCLFSSIGYVKTFDNLTGAVQSMASHLLPGGVLILEPWLTPDAYCEGTVHAIFTDEPDLKIARMSVSEQRGDVAVMEMHYMLATPHSVEHFMDLHELGLFSRQEYAAAFHTGGLEMTHLENGLIGRGLYIGVKPVE